MDTISETSACEIINGTATDSLRRILRQRAAFEFRRSAGGHWIRHYDRDEVESLAEQLAKESLTYSRNHR